MGIGEYFHNIIFCRNCFMQDFISRRSRFGAAVLLWAKLMTGCAHHKCPNAATNGRLVCPAHAAMLTSAGEKINSLNLPGVALKQGPKKCLFKSQFLIHNFSEDGWLQFLLLGLVAGANVLFFFLSLSLSFFLIYRLLFLFFLKHLP